MKKESIHPAKALSGGLQLPGDKSISHRYAMIAALAEGTSELRNFAAARDCHSTLGCMKALGAEVAVDKTTVKVTGRGLRGLKSSWRTLDAENSGTTIRLLSGILSGQSFTTKITGDASLQKRPMKRVVTPLRQMGADIRAKDDNFPPLEIHGSKLKAIHYEMPMASAQVKSAVLLAGLFADGDTRVTEPATTRDHTELALSEFGAHIEKSGRTITVRGMASASNQATLQARSLEIPGDLSSAVFFYCGGFAPAGLRSFYRKCRPESHALRDTGFFSLHGRGVKHHQSASESGRSRGRSLRQRRLVEGWRSVWGPCAFADRRTADARGPRAIH